MENNKLYYNGTDIDIRLGDRVIYKIWWLFKKEAIVVYIPSQSKMNKEFGEDSWVLQLDESKEYIEYAYFPEIGEVIPKKITFR